MRSRRLRRYLPFLPSVGLGVVGGVWVWISKPDLGVAQPLWLQLLLGVATGAGLLLGGWLLEKLVPSFGEGSNLIERMLRRLRLSRFDALLLATLTAVGEELLFRGGLLPLLGVPLQALLFALLHPAPPRAWVYTAYTGVAGLALGYAAVGSGGLLAPILAHFLVNAQGLLSVRRRRPAGPVQVRSRQARSSGER